MAGTTLVVTGMFRSGTTLLARMLHAHPDIAFASDPYRPMYNSLRTEVASDLGLTIPPTAPLADYYLDPEQLPLFEAIQRTTLDHNLEKGELERLRKRIRTHSTPHSPHTANCVDDLEGTTYAELFDQMVQLTRDAYGSRDEEIVGFKEVWTSEFAPAIARSRPESKFIHVIRDPRAVATSKNARQEKYPWLFLARQWRKLACLPWAYANAPNLRDRTLILHFEDLISGPRETADRICSFLHVPPVAEMTDPSEYVDGAGRPWAQNTSYGPGKDSFDESTIGKWRTRLDPSIKSYLEALCAPEMLLHGYEPEGIPSAPDPLDAPIVDEANLADWMRGTIPNDDARTAILTAQEKIRYDLLQESAGTEHPLILHAFLNEVAYQEIRDRFVVDAP